MNIRERVLILVKIKFFYCFFLRCQWHGPHAVKELELDPNIAHTSEKYKLFRQEILNLCKTRHANLILFVGACMEPPNLAIVMRYFRLKIIIKI